MTKDKRIIYYFTFSFLGIRGSGRRGEGRRGAGGSRGGGEGRGGRGRGGHPSGLSGKDIGLWYARRGKERKKKLDIENVRIFYY